MSTPWPIARMAKHWPRGSGFVGPNELEVWDMETGKELASLKKQDDVVCTLAYNPAGTLLASGSWDGTVVLWNVTHASERTVRSEGR